MSHTLGSEGSQNVNSKSVLNLGYTSTAVLGKEKRNVRSLTGFSFKSYLNKSSCCTCGVFVLLQREALQYGFYCLFCFSPTKSLRFGSLDGLATILDLYKSCFIN